MPTTSTTELTTVDGTALNTYAYNITSGTGRYTTPSVRGSNVQLPGRDGELYVPMKASDTGIVTLTMWVAGCNTDGTIPVGNSAQRTKFDLNVDMIHRLFTKRHALIDILQVKADGTTRECHAEVLESISPTTMAAKNRAEFAVNLRIPDVYWQDTAPVTQTFTNMTFTSGATTQNFTSFSKSTGYINDSVITVLGPIASPTVTDVASGISVTYSSSVAAGASWVIDSSAWTSKVNGVSVLSSTSHLGSNYFMVVSPTNPPQLKLAGGSPTTATAITLQARNKYVS